MKKFVFILFFILLSFCGCIVNEREVADRNFLNEPRFKIKIVIPKFFSQDIEQKAVEFKRKKPDVCFEFIRVEDDALYRKAVLKEILNNDADLFYVHGEKDVFFFKDLIKKFSFDEKKYKAIYINNLPVFYTNRNFFGIYYNSELLNSYGINENKIKSYDDFIKAIEKIKKNPQGLKQDEIVCVEKDIFSLVCSLGFLDGNISCAFKDIFKFKIQDEKDLGLTFFADKQVFFIGGSRFFNCEFLNKNKNKFKCLALPIEKNNSIIYEDDYFCVNKSISTEKQAIVLEFLNFISSFEKNFNSNSNLKESQLKKMPIAFKYNFFKEFEYFRKNKTDFKTFQQSLKKHYDRFKNID